MIRRLLLALAFVPGLLLAETQQPPFEEKAWETNENMRQAFLELDTLRSQAAEQAAEQAAATDRASGMKNRIINGAFAINQRSTNSATDDVYHVDRWYALTQTSSVTIAVQTLEENGQPTNLRIGQPGTAQRIGTAQIIEDENSQDLRGSAVTLSARIRCSSAQAIRYAILESTQTPDTVTSDVVNSWTNATFTAGQFFISGLVVAGTGSTTPTANTWASISLTATLSSNVDNIIVFFWTEGTLAQTATLDIGKVQLEAGSAATAFERRPFSHEIDLCERYYEKSAQLSAAPHAVFTLGGVGNVGVLLFGYLNTAALQHTHTFRKRKPYTPTVTVSDASGATGVVSYYFTGWNNGGVGTPTVSETMWTFRDATMRIVECRMSISAEL